MYNKSDNGNKLLSFCVWVFFLISNWDPSSPPDKQAAPATVKNLDVCNA